MTKLSRDKSLIRFLLLEGVHHAAVDVLDHFGDRNVDVLSHSLAGNELRLLDGTIRARPLH